MSDIAWAALVLLTVTVAGVIGALRVCPGLIVGEQPRSSPRVIDAIRLRSRRNAQSTPPAAGKSYDPIEKSAR